MWRELRRMQLFPSRKRLREDAEGGGYASAGAAARLEAENGAMAALGARLQAADDAAGVDRAFVSKVMSRERVKAFGGGAGGAGGLQGAGGTQLLDDDGFDGTHIAMGLP